jgi:hypothetical protein
MLFIIMSRYVSKFGFSLNIYTWYFQVLLLGLINLRLVVGLLTPVFVELHTNFESLTLNLGYWANAILAIYLVLNFISRVINGRPLIKSTLWRIAIPAVILITGDLSIVDAGVASDINTSSSGESMTGSSSFGCDSPRTGSISAQVEESASSTDASPTQVGEAPAVYNPKYPPTAPKPELGPALYDTGK